MRHTTGTAVQIDRLSAGYARHPVLHDITAAIPRARITAIVGANGSGKSTLLGVLAGVIPALTGTVQLSSTHKPAFVLQHSAIPATLPLTVRETVAMGRWAHRGPWRPLSRHDRAVVHACLDRMAITDLAGRRLDTLSGGQRQRTLLAQALAQEADLLLLDEPATGLDSASRQEISHILIEVSAEGVTVVQATHDADEAACAHHRLVLDAGRLLAGEEQPCVTEPRSAAPAHLRPNSGWRQS